MLKEYDNMKEKRKNIKTFHGQKKQFIKDFTLFEQCYHIAWSLEKKPESKNRGFKRKIKENKCFYQNVQCEQEGNGLLNNLELKTPLSKIPLLGDVLFSRYEMNEIVNKLFIWQ